MDFVDLERLFAPIKGEDHDSLDVGILWGKKLGGWLDWNELLTYRRVALLAEALSGKTQELQHRAEQLVQAGKHAFFVRIEDLADDSFEGALDAHAVAAFEAWRDLKANDAWFFLDSVDEARLNGKRFDVALRKFAKELGVENLGRAHVIVSCRVSDWQGKSDRDALKQRLPYVAAPRVAEKVADLDQELLAPIFSPTDQASRDRRKPSEPHPSELLVVRLVNLTDMQKGQFIRAAGIEDAPGFLQSVGRSGLTVMTERPGDLLDLIGYWKEHARFGTLAEMTEHGIARKLREENAFRVDAMLLTPERARQGAERLAAALVLAKTFTLKAPGEESDPTLALGAIDAHDVLPDWTQAELNALLRKGAFAPATYGRIRFHHRSSQEYLAACWLDRLLQNNCPVEEVHRLLFAELYGVETVAPSLRPTAAWLALRHSSIREEIVRREPVALIRYGDPKSLPLDARKDLLAAYAELDAKGQLNPELIDQRAVWMFADRALDTAIRDAWNANQRDGFRFELLRLIEEASIERCVDLARTIALDKDQDDYARTVAVRAMANCNDLPGLKLLARDVKATPDRLSAKLAPSFALALYPGYLSTSDLLDLIDRSQPARPYKSEGFSAFLRDLHASAPDRNAQKQFAFGVADICATPPHSEVQPRISVRHRELAKGLWHVAAAELASRGSGNVEPQLVDMLQRAARGAEFRGDEGQLQPFLDQVKADKAFNRELMWAEARMGWNGEPREKPISGVWQIGPFGATRLWSIDVSDLEWLIEDCRKRTDPNERRIAFSGVYMVLRQEGMLGERAALVEEVAGFDEAFRADLAEYEAPPQVSHYDLQHEEFRRKQEEEQNQAKRSWITFRESLTENPGILSDPDSLGSWRSGLFRLNSLTDWVKARAMRDGLQGPRHWRLLREAFDERVVEHYLAAMRLVWKFVKPERPVYKGNGTYSTKVVSALAIDSLAIDSAEVSDWECQITDAEVEQAIRHGCYAGQVSADWFEKLVASRTGVALPIVEVLLAKEFRSAGARSDLMTLAAFNETAARPTIARSVLKLLKASEPVDDITFDRALQILSRSRSEVPAAALSRLVASRAEEHLVAGNEKRAMRYFGLETLLQPDAAVLKLIQILEQRHDEPDVDLSARAERWLGGLFGSEGHGGYAIGALPQMSAKALTHLLKLAYSFVPIREDADPEAENRLGRRDAAESSRRAVLNALIASPGADAFHCLKELAADPVFSASALRFRELAHGKAERDGDIRPWSTREVVDLEKMHVSPAKTGHDLLRIVLGVLSDIVMGFVQADATSRGLLSLARDEEQVQNWLAERLRERSKARYHVHREPEVAKKNEPDIVISSTSADTQVAIEVKNANKGWTVAKLESTLQGQLARDYLRTDNRRHGILVVSRHQPRTWRSAGRTWEFTHLMAHLDVVAQRVECNETGPVVIRAVGIDASEKASTRADAALGDGA
ncbi:hypothetical protein R69619_03706 [Paraburkholderia nemoris]|uniref:hypothetical protein n=1 Tax=Paraburkholderia nemoris TaxID=2793076 RepID=UPI00190A255F|nr:hypothetical protein [Paraburkholderia nemoris]MBK3744184.1 hypothetical protein [Paraburkholderia aspalathi]CAE6767999.1 hypothetical protein R69619_03706 [Paraburkholderia nemoris]